MHHVKSSPPLALLRDWVARLEGQGVEVALGGSGLLAALGLADTIRDWDLTTDAPYARALAAVAGADAVAHGSDDLHADRKLALAGGVLELIVGFAFHGARGVIRVPTLVSARMDGIPIGSPEAWAVAYHLLGREAKSEALLDHLERRGAARDTIARLLLEPIPHTLAERLAGLPTSRST
jgi:hypothetical protein